MMDVVIIDVPPTYGMMLAKHLGTSIEVLPIGNYDYSWID